MTAKNSRYKFVKASFTHYLITGGDDLASHEFGRLHNQGGGLWSIHIADQCAFVDGFQNAKARAAKALDALAAVLHGADFKITEEAADKVPEAEVEGSAVMARP